MTYFNMNKTTQTINNTNQSEVGLDKEALINARKSSLKEQNLNCKGYLEL